MASNHDIRCSNQKLTKEQQEQRERFLKKVANYKLTPQEKAHFEDDAYWDKSQAEALAKVNKSDTGGLQGKKYPSRFIS